MRWIDLPRRWWTGPLIFGLTLIFVCLLGKFTSTLRGFTGIPKSRKAFAEKSSATDTDKAIDDALVVSFQNFDPATPATAAPVIEGLSDAREAGLITTNDLGRDLFSEKRSARLDLHRLQIAAFTGFYVFVFLWSVNAVLALPEFSSNTLALLGASTASYLGYKFAAQ